MFDLASAAPATASLPAAKEASCSLPSIIEGWSDKDYTEVGVDRTASETDLLFIETLGSSLRGPLAKRKEEGLFKTELTLVAERLLRRPDSLERLCRKHLKSLEGPKRLELVVEMSERAQERGEVAAFSANVLKKIVQGWTDKELEEMGVDRATAEEKTGLYLGLIPEDAWGEESPLASAKSVAGKESSSLGTRTYLLSASPGHKASRDFLVL